ncbi:MAG: ribosome biogenesis GTPase Der [Dehalococcoidales bacterium]
MANFNPIVAIIGRQNVGKSTLLNRLAGRQIAITQDLPGTTRDRVFAPVLWQERGFTIVDTGGLEIKPRTTLAQQVNQQVQAAISEADILLFLVDAKDGLTPVDRDIADQLRRVDKPVLLVANKADNARLEAEATEFHELGLGQPLIISAYHGRSVGELLESITAVLPTMPPPAAEPALKVAIVGRANVGKSTLLNRLLGQPRAIVAATPGTTRDATDTPLDFEGQNMILIDTAGIRRRGKIERGVEQYSVLRALKAIDRADVVLLVLDATELATAQDTHVAGYIGQAAKGIVLVVNKQDLVSDLNQADLDSTVGQRFKFMPYAPVVLVSAKEGQGVENILPKVSQIFRERQKRVSTAEVNSTIRAALADHSPPRRGKKRLNVLYATQAEVNPPTFVFFVNDARLMHFSYQRYLENRLRQSFGFDGTPVRLLFKSRGEK